MGLYAIIVVLFIFLIFIILRAAFELFRFCIKMICLNRRLKKLSGDVTVEYVQPFSKIAFGDKGKTNFKITKNDVIYDVTVLSFPVIRGRWNLEKVGDRYYAEVRVYNNMFYNVYNNSGTEPEHSNEYRRETRIIRKRLYLSSEKSEGEKIILICPKPKKLTYTDSKLEYINSGDKVFGYKILFENYFFEKFEK